MTDAQAILKMIEEVDPADTAALDEIDARVWCFVQKIDTEYEYSDGRFVSYHQPLHAAEGEYWSAHDFPEYTRSRDALKATRPDGCTLCIKVLENGSDIGWLYPKDSDDAIYAPLLPTEELAELYVIIQAIEYERTNSE